MYGSTLPLNPQDEDRSPARVGEGGGGRRREHSQPIDSVDTPPPPLKLVRKADAALEREERLHFFSDDEAIVTAMIEELDVGEVEAVRAIRDFGLRRVEGAVLKTINSPGIRSPAGWFYSTLAKGLEWTAKEVELYAQRHGVSGAPRNRRIEDEWGRWATYLMRGERPPNYTDWTEANRERYDQALTEIAGGDSPRSSADRRL